MHVVAGLDELVQLVGVSESELMERWGDAPVSRSAPRDYEGLKGLTLLQSPSQPGVYAYLKDQRVTLVHVAGGTALAGADATVLREVLGPAAGELRSREGKQYRLYVWPEAGIAASLRHAHEVGFVELFEPTSMESYEADVYIDVGSFTK